MDNLFKVRVLTLAVNNMKSVGTKVLDRVFRRRQGQLSDRLAFDVKSGSEAILSNVSVYAPATVQGKTSRKTITLQAPRFPQKRFISAAELNAVRGFGQQAATELMSTRIGDEQADMRLEIDRTREFMALKALGGQVVDGAGTVLVDYGFAGDQAPTLLNTDRWSQSASDPVKDIRSWKKYISDRVPSVSEWIAFCGSGAMDYLISNEKAMARLQYTAGQQIAEEGRVTRLAGVMIDEYFGTYLDGNAARQDMIGQNDFILVGWSPDSFSEQYAPSIDDDDPNGVGKGVAGQLFFSKSWKEEDPSGRWIKVEARPIPVVHRPEAIVIATVA